MVHVIAEFDVLVVHDKLSESCNPRDSSRLLHLLNTKEDWGSERTLMRFPWNLVSSLPSNTGVGDLGVGGGGKGIRGRAHLRASTKDPVRMIAAGLPTAGSFVGRLG